ncbi:MAG: TonB-dependent receptor [Asticcacaulis sp.]
MRGANRRAVWLTALMMTTVLGAGATPALAQEQVQSETREYNIRAQPLAEALIQFARQSGLQVSAETGLTQNLRTQGVRGRLTEREALTTLLSGTGLTYRLNGTMVALEKAVAADGTIRLGAIRVEGAVAGGGVASTGGDTAIWDGTSETVYRTPGSVSVINREQIEQYRGTTPSDILKSAPGVLSGESRANGGIDVNIRGLQGQGRVVVTVDGAQNSTSVYRGYQGIANRTFIDPDFISSVSVEKGPSAQPGSAGAIGGTLTLRTLSADDIVGEGEVIGVRLKVEQSGNTIAPDRDRIVSKYPDQDYVTTTGKPRRPSDLDMNSGSYSMVIGTKSDRFDTVFGYSQRSFGNYHAGEKGSLASEQVACDTCGDGTYRYKLGLTSYLSGEEVLNTSQSTESYLLKGTVRLTDTQTLELGASRYDSHYGETFPVGMWNNQGSVSQTPLSEIKLDSYTARYAWNPDSEWIELKANLWSTEMTELSISGSNTDQSHKWGRSKGADISNLSRLSLAGKPLIWQYGLAYQYESTGPDRTYYVGIPPREGKREVSSAFTNAKWQALGWLSLSGGLRYQRYESVNQNPLSQKEKVSGNGTDLSLAAAVDTPLDGLQVYAKYDRAYRLPSLFESVGAFATQISPDLKPEQARNVELGANFERRSVFRDTDEVGVKLSYFDNQTNDYIYRQWSQVCIYEYNGTCYYYSATMKMDNIDKAKFSGYELSAQYQNLGFRADFNATYYDNVEFCRTASTCKGSSLAADYATNHIPPEYRLSLTLSQRLLKNRLGLSARVSRTGSRAAEAEPTSGGASPFIAMVGWKPYTVTDIYADYALTESAKFYVSAENAFDTYYVEPLGLALMPSPGRTLKFGLTAAFGGPKSAHSFAAANRSSGSGEVTDWSGVYGGIYGFRATGPVSAEDWGAGGVRRLEINGYTSNNVGIQLGYNYQFAKRFVVGPVIDYTRLGADIEKRFYSEYRVNLKIDSMTTAGIRLGYATDQGLVYAVGGRAVADTRSTLGYRISRLRPEAIYEGQGQMRGTFIGAGVEYALSKHWSFTGEYRATQFEDGDYWSQTQNILFGSSSVDLTYGWRPNARFDVLKAGLNYRF